MHWEKQFFGEVVYLSGHNGNLSTTSRDVVSIQATVPQKKQPFKSQVRQLSDNIKLTCLHPRTHDAELGFEKRPSRLGNKAPQPQTTTP